jgi:hypothetical protein
MNINSNALAHEIAPRCRLRFFVAAARVRDLSVRAKDLLKRAIAATRMVFNEQMSDEE